MELSEDCVQWFLNWGNLCVTSGNNQVADTFELGPKSVPNFAT